jgi:hypothetical protein
VTEATASRAVSTMIRLGSNRSRRAAPSNPSAAYLPAGITRASPVMSPAETSQPTVIYWARRKLLRAGALESSQDLRDRVIDAVERNGMSRRAGARRYEITSGRPPAACAHTSRHGGFEGSLRVKFTGPMPQMAITTGSLWLRITPS